MENNATPSIEVLLAGVPMFSSLAMPELSRLAHAARKLSAGKGEILFHKDDACHGFYLIVSGKIKLVLSSAGGNEKVVEILVPGHTFGEAVMFMDKPYPLSAHVLTDSVLVYVTKTSIFEALESNPLLARKLITGLSIRLHQLVQNQEFNSLRSGKQRVADYLVRQLPAEENSSPTPSLVLPASKGTVASHLGITPEHFSRILHELIDSELITVNGKNIQILDLPEIKELIDAPASTGLEHSVASNRLGK